MAYPTGVQTVNTITVGASGITNVYPAQANCPFGRLGISIVPVDAAHLPYKVDLYHDGELEETHTFPDPNDRVVCHMLFPDLIFPANVGTSSIPAFFAADKSDPYGVPIMLVLTNQSANTRTFLVYATYEEYEDARFNIKRN